MVNNDMYTSEMRKREKNSSFGLCTFSPETIVGDDLFPTQSANAKKKRG
jgi:hypothetical protein